MKRTTKILFILLMLSQGARAQLADKILSISGPKKVYSSSFASVKVTYEASSTRKIGIVFQKDSPSWTNYGFNSARVEAGRGTIYINVRLDHRTPIKDDAHKFVAFITDEHGSWAERFDNKIQHNIDFMAKPSSDKLFEVNAPTHYTPGETAYVSLTYQATTNRTILISFKNKASGETYGSKTVPVMIGSESITIDVDIDKETPIEDGAYRLDASLLSCSGNSTNILDSRTLDGLSSVAASSAFTVYPEEYPKALRNPLKGFRPDMQLSVTSHKYAMITRHYIKWNELENDESDTTQKIIDYCNEKWVDLEKHGIKVIPRVYLDWDKEEGNEYWPADMTTGDYSSEQFKQRLQRLIKRLGQAWDNDPRVAWVQSGIIGVWGEHHHPSPSAEIQMIMGDAFTAAFTNKKVLVRHANEFADYDFGVYWDSWAHVWQTDHKEHGAAIKALNNRTGRWKNVPIEGEAAYNWGNYTIQPGKNPDNSLSDPVHRDFIIDTIRDLHCTGLGWIAHYNQNDDTAKGGAEEVQKAFGYRFVIDQFSCSRRADPGETLQLKFSVLNTGSSPIYENWPLAFSLLDPTTYEPIWTTILDHVDIRSWLPGDDWDAVNDFYRSPPKRQVVSKTIHLPDNPKLPKGEYITTLSILDPIGLTPSVRFAIKNYLSGGVHPFSRIGIGRDLDKGPALNPTIFNDPMKEPRLPYALR